jgi:hypothetical protein
LYVFIGGRFVFDVIVLDVIDLGRRQSAAAIAKPERRVNTRIP